MLFRSVSQSRYFPREKCILCFGDFSQLSLEDNSLDFVVICQSFHHTNEPLSLLQEMKRVVKKSGYILLLAEPVLSYRQIIRRYVRHVVLYYMSSAYRKTNTLFVPYKELFSDAVKGDVHLLRDEYFNLAKQLELTVQDTVDATCRLSLILQK